MYLGGYDKEEKVVRVYDLVVLKYWGFNMIINFLVCDEWCGEMGFEVVDS